MFYQLKVIRQKTKPPIWRRVIVPSNITFAQLAMILEEIVELPQSSNFEFQFFTKKERISEWKKENISGSDYNYTYRNAPDTFINSWMENEKTFTFYLTDHDKKQPEYKCEIEKDIPGFSFKDPITGEKQTGNSPMIVKDTSPVTDTFWSEPQLLNEKLMEKFSIMNQRTDAEYLSFSEIEDLIHNGKGLTVYENLIDRQIHTKKSVKIQMKEFGEQFEKMQEQLRKINEENEEFIREFKSETSKSTSEKREEIPCVFRDMLKSYSIEELHTILNRFGLKTTAKQKAKLVDLITQHYLQPDTVKYELLQVDEKVLDLFEQLIEKPFKPTEEQWKLLSKIYTLNFVATYTNGIAQVPDEIRDLYQKLLSEGYREYHKKASWLIQCLKLCAAIYMVFSVKVLYRIFKQNTQITATYREFVAMVKDLPVYLTGCVLQDEELISDSIYGTFLYQEIKEKQKDIDYDIPSVKEIQTFAEYNYPAAEKPYEDLYTFCFDTLKLSENLAHMSCSKAFYMFCGGYSVQNFIQEFAEEYAIELNASQEKNLRFLASIVEQNTRKAYLKGRRNDPNKLNVLAPKKEKRIYPNDPCPCGSGKKYKKCCGK